ncbi:uridine kinase [Mycolicibacterium sp. HK-90]|uniref:uridine kinase n=1 Tax=Mycolicibacterium sp. HK-90 TaxID=3056937 RepID=UPI00265A5590|nr:uridine kinase [Mycolicibacterium sp. HK-90]WKG00824.1 uridine kinase [Mycolicibacterium sp. HK-90]
MTLSPASYVVNQVADRIAAMPLPGPRVAIDGPDGAGKTHFADQLAVVLRSRHRRATVRISVDDFHNSRAVRYRQGRDSPLGFWADSYNYDRFRRDVLEPFSSGGSRRFRRAGYSHETDEILYPDPEIAEPTAVLLVDGIFLQRVELRAQWDLTVFLDVTFTETAKRMALRDGTPSDPEDPRMRRYIEGQREYFRQCDPQRRAHILIDNNNFDHPAILRDRTPEPG